jgi:streptogramin lyase
MNEQQRNREVQQTLTSWMDGVAPAQAPTRLLEETFASTLTTRQARAWPWQRVEIGGGVPALGSPRAAIALVVLGLLVAMVLAVGLAGGSPNATASPTLGPTPRATASPALSPASGPSGPALPASIAISTETTIGVPDLLDFELDATQLVGLGQGQMVRVDLGTGEVMDTVALGGPTDLYNGFASNDDGLWATDSDNRTLYRVDPTTFKVVARIPGGLAPKGVLANADGVWVADVHGGAVLRIDPATNALATSISVGPTGPSGPNWLASGLGSIWVDIPNTRSVVRIDPVTDLVEATLRAPDGFTACGGLLTAADALWVGTCEGSPAVARFDPATNLPVTIVPVPGYGGLTLIGDAVWASVDTGDPNTGLLIRIDPATNTIDRVLEPDVLFAGGGNIAVVGDSVWVHDWSRNRLLRFPLAAFSAA